LLACLVFKGKKKKEIAVGASGQVSSASGRPPLNLAATYPLFMVVSHQFQLLHCKLAMPSNKKEKKSSCIAGTGMQITS
jgi:hypothetical protein